ncbi:MULTISPECIES: sensor domain-containing diguanylate cyclase [Pseudomonas putida group]|uniref:Putative diguanylate cyclase YegE n=1 Tax=Pseudomonas putida TaxID=303 RepID=A0A1B2F244_PSEPU|nr:MULTISPECIES: sensor domain-containing diguanylate cyclase [Pseudomonas putida group]ANY86298.1 putative diguanylate cyclase YegE [Pseudomonas putida]MCL8308428.1 diguanylate cyclase [Pseudomonas putida]
MIALFILLAALPCLTLLWVLHRQRQEHCALLAELDVGVLQLSRNGRVSWHNRAAAELLGHASTPLLGLRLRERLPQWTAPASTVQVTGDNGQQRALHISQQSATHATQWLLIRPILVEAERFQRSQYFARIGTWDWDIDTNHLYWSDAIFGMFGYSINEVTPSYELFCNAVYPDDRARVRAGELRCIETGENHDEEYRVVWPDGTLHWLRETGNVVKDELGTPIKMMGVVRDITEEKAWANQLHRLAHHDPLTGLPNRLVFEERLEGALALARRNNSRVALVFIDLNGFKVINDSLGHAAGDQVLKITATRLHETLRNSDSVARLGGDEFVTVLEGLSAERTPEDEARVIAQRLLAALDAPISVGNARQRVGASLGIALFPDHAQTRDQLIHVADLAMYEAKRSGDNQYRLGQAQTQVLRARND